MRPAWWAQLGLAIITALVQLAPIHTTVNAAESAVTPAQVGADGVVQLPKAGIPMSNYMSAQAREGFIKRFYNPDPETSIDSVPRADDIRRMRESDERHTAPYASRAEELYPVNIEHKLIGGVRTEVFTPKEGVAPRNRHRLLINLHGGAFLWGEGHGAESESIPIAGTGKIVVVTVAYREGPEFKFPAASEDVAAVYRELLKKYRSMDIGIYGCSAGAILTAEAIAWFEKEKLPLPGAIGTFCGSADAFAGDSAYLAPLLVGRAPPASSAEVGSLSGLPYFNGASTSDPLVLPVNSAQVLSRFPPTLLIAGSRDFAVSSMFHVQAALTDVGVEAELHIWDGMWHAFIMDPDLPESKQAYRVVARFFDRHLGQH